MLPETGEVSWFPTCPGRDAHSPDVTHRGPQVQGAVGEGAVRPVLHAVASGVSLVDARARLVVAQVVLALGVAGCPVQVRTPGEQRGTQAVWASGPGDNLSANLLHFSFAPGSSWLLFSFPRLSALPKGWTSLHGPFGPDLEALPRALRPTHPSVTRGRTHNTEFP